MRKVLTIGGGGGQSTVLRALLYMSGVKITAITGVTDSGGSTEVLRELYGTSRCIGDASKCVMALSKKPWASVSNTRFFAAGKFPGHSLKNLGLAALELECGDIVTALDVLGAQYGIAPHEVLPASRSSSNLYALLGATDGHLDHKSILVDGETNLDTLAENFLHDPERHKVSSMYILPEVKICPETERAIAEANWVIISPGDLYTSIVPALLVSGMAEAIQKTEAKLLLILNLFTKAAETHGYQAEDFVRAVEKYTGRVPDVVLGNRTCLSSDQLEEYKKERKSPIIVQKTSISDSPKPEIVSADLLTLADGTAKHDAEKLRSALSFIFSPEY